MEGFKDCEHAFDITFSLSRSQPKFDLVFIEDLFFYAYFGLIHYVGSPHIIAIQTVEPTVMALENMGNSRNPSYVSSMPLPFSDHMTFWQRLVNTVSILYLTGKSLPKILIDWMQVN